MSRKSTKTPPSVTPKKKDFISETRKYKLITPLYGGGVEPEKADPITVVRATEVRGHLRFWWRATRGGAFGGSLEKMREREEEIFGSAAGEGKPGPSRVTVIIKNGWKGTKDSPFEVVPNKHGKPQVKARPKSKVPAYAAFPLQPKQEDARIGMETASVRIDASFELKITYQKADVQDIQAALWAWETFGGIGARTRRGFGALQRTDISIPAGLTTKDTKSWIKEGLKKYVKDSKWPDDVPHLSNSLVYKPTSQKDNGMDAWEYLIAALQSFRQTNARYAKKTGEQSDFGMSRWPEANEVRRYFDRNPALPKDVTPNNLVQKMPRAQFGLPIILHMAHDDGLKDKEIKLEGKNHDRLASPLILRPLACKDGAVGLAVILDTPRTPPDGLVLKGTPRGVVDVKSNLEGYEAKKIPMLDGKVDILKAFLDYLN